MRHHVVTALIAVRVKVQMLFRLSSYKQVAEDPVDLDSKAVEDVEAPVAVEAVDLATTVTAVLDLRQ